MNLGAIAIISKNGSPAPDILIYALCRAEEGDEALLPWATVYKQA
jgi:hypothetical protein